MRRVELHDDHILIVLTGLTMLEALQGHLEIPFVNIRHVYPKLYLPAGLVKLGGTPIGATPEGHYIGDDGWYFLSFEHEDRVITLELDDFHLGRQHYLGVAVEVDEPQSVAEAIKAHLPPSA